MSNDPYELANELELEVRTKMGAVEKAIEEAVADAEISRLENEFYQSEKLWLTEVQRVLQKEHVPPKGAHDWKPTGGEVRGWYRFDDVGTVMSCSKCRSRFIHWPDGRLQPLVPFHVSCSK